MLKRQPRYFKRQEYAKDEARKALRKKLEENPSMRLTYDKIGEIVRRMEVKIYGDPGEIYLAGDE